MPGYAVVDLETTGLFPGGQDRIIEIAVVLTDRTGEVEETWCTLVNPERDLGPQNVHGISAADVLGAPRFADVAGELAARLAGRALVAHNASFDSRFLTAAYGSLGHQVPLGPETTVCTMRWSSQLLPGAPRTLAGCCGYLGVPLEHHHSALSDATAAAGVLGHLIQAGSRRGQLPWWQVIETARHSPWPSLTRSMVTPVQRGHAAAEFEVPFLMRLVDSLPSDPLPAHEAEYLALLDRALLDRHLAVRERDALVRAAHEFGVDQPTAFGLHHRYLRSLAREALHDAVVTDTEYADLHAVAELLDLDSHDVDSALHASPSPSAPAGISDDDGAASVERFTLRPGDLVVLTGQMSEPRDVWQERARAAGLVPHSGVTRKVALVVAADPDSLSGKARKSADYGIPIVTEEAFAEMLASGDLRVSL